MLLAGGALAGDEAPPAGRSAQANQLELEPVVVSGRRQSLATAREIRRDRVGIVDAVVADDIQKLPDTSVTEALQRIPGVQIGRDRGEATALTIRGLTQVETTINGREIFTAGTGRGLDFADLAAELLARVDIHKTASAEQIEGGIGGLVDLRMHRPFDFAGDASSASARIAHSDLADRDALQFSTLLSRRWDAGGAGEAGFLFSLAHQQRAWREDQKVSGNPAARSDIVAGRSVVVPSGTSETSSSGTHERNAVNLVLQWRPDDALELYAEANYAEFLTRQDSHQVNVFPSSSFVAGSAELIPGSDDLRRITWTNAPVSILSFARDTFDRSRQGAVGASWQGDKATLQADLSYTSGESGLFFSGPFMAATAARFSHDLSSDIPATRIEGTDLNDPSNLAFSGLAYRVRPFEGDLAAARFDGEYRLEGFVHKLSGGLRLARRSATNAPGLIFGDISLGGRAATDLPQFLMPFPREDFLRGSGTSIGDFLAGNLDGARDAAALRAAFGIAEALPTAGDPLGVWKIRDDTDAAYLVASFASERHPFDGNLGLRVVRGRTAVSGATRTDTVDPASGARTPGAVVPKQPARARGAAAEPVPPQLRPGRHLRACAVVGPARIQLARQVPVVDRQHRRRRRAAGLYRGLRLGRRLPRVPRARPADAEHRGQQPARHGTPGLLRYLQATPEHVAKRPLPGHRGLPALLTAAGRRGPRAAGVVRFALVLIAFVLLPASAAAADSAIDRWQADVERVRVLAENDCPQAHREALRLQAALPAEALPADRVRALNLVARTALYLGSTEESFAAARSALDIARQHDDRAGQAEADLNLVLLTLRVGDIPGLIEFTTHSLDVLEGIERADLLAEAMLRNSMLYRRLGRIDESVELAIQTLEVARSSGDPLALAYAHHGLAIAFDLSVRHSEAIEHYSRMVEFASRAGYQLLSTDALLGLGRAVSHYAPEQGAALVREAIERYRRIGAPVNLALGLFALAAFEQQKGDQPRALELLDQVGTIYRRHPSKLGNWYTLNARSESHHALGNVALAAAEAEQALRIARQVDLPLYVSESSRRVAALAAEASEHERAYKLLEDAGAMLRRAESIEAGARVLALTRRYESEGKRRQIDELTRRNELQSAELERRTLRQGWLWTVLIGSVVALAGVAFFLLRLRRANQLLASSNQDLQQSRDQVRELNAGLEQRVFERTSELRRQTRYLRTLIDSLPLWVWLKDTGGRFLAVNSTAAETRHLTADEVIGKTDDDLHQPELAALFRADDVEVMQTRRAKTTEECQPLDGGAVMWLETFKAPVIDEDDTVLGTVGFARDISERKAAEAAREAALAEAQRLARLRSDFLAQMSHELRTPLNGILGYAQILELDPTLDARQRSGVGVIRESGEHLLTLINDILELTKIEAGKLELQPGEVELARFLETITGIIRVKAEHKLLAFECELSPTLPDFVRTDEKRLRQVLLNLLANAVRFTEHGRITLRARFTPPDRLRFEVEDTGPGIAAERMISIFEPFEQAGELAQRVGGTGLGLAISRQLVQLMGGDIGVDSRPGEGSRFSLELAAPALPRPPSARPAARRIVGYAGPRRKLMIVDDVDTNRAVLKDMLAPLGFELCEAASGEEALERIGAEAPALLLLDVVLQGISGLQVAARLRQSADGAALPIIVVSASTSDSDAQRCLAAGVEAFLPKPVDRSALLLQIGRLLQLRWIDEEHGHASDGSVAIAADEPIEAPPPAALETLLQLARQGDMREIAREAERLATEASRYRPFAERVKQLAAGYQSQALLRLVQSHYDGILDA